MEIYFDNRQNKVDIDREIEESIEKTIELVLVLENRNLDYEVSVSFVDNNEIRLLNKQFRDKDVATDVLSFPMEDEWSDEEFLEEENAVLGDIVISCERAFEQSKEFDHSYKREILYLTAHSMLHLLGYDHMDSKEKDIMRSKEKMIMKKMEIFK